MEGREVESSLKLVRQHYTAFSCGDIDGLVAGLDPGVAITVHDEHGVLYGEPIRGREAARTFFEGISAAVTHSSVEVSSLRADGNRVLAKVTIGGTLRASGRTGAIPAIHLFKIYDGLITEIRTHRPDWRGDDAETFSD